MPSIWRQIQRKNFTILKALSAFLEWDEKMEEKALPRAPFTLNLPFRLASKIQKKTLNDPILRQFLPIKEENENKLGFVLDPVQDTTFIKEKKLLHKYEGRALLVTSGACAMHCRYCFRKNFPYESIEKDFSKELKEIGRAHV